MQMYSRFGHRHGDGRLKEISLKYHNIRCSSKSSYMVALSTEAGIFEENMFMSSFLHYSL